MRILVLTNRDDYEYSKIPHGVAAIAYFFEKKGNVVRKIGKSSFGIFFLIYKKFNPDVIVTCWVPAGFIPALLKKVGVIKCPLIHFWDDHYAEMMVGKPKRVVKFMERFTIKHSDAIVTVSGDNTFYALKENKRVYLVDHGRAIGKIKTKINLKSLKTNSENIIAIYLGEQSKYKRVDEIIDSVRGQKCDLYLFGTINPKLKINAPENVHFMGSIDGEEVNSVLKQADILVNTSDLDFNFKWFEYIYAQKPILGIKGRAEYRFKHLETAYLAEDIGKGIKLLIEDQKLREKIKRNLKKIKTLSWEEASEDYYSSIMRTLKGDLNEERVTILSPTINYLFEPDPLQGLKNIWKARKLK